MLGEVSLYKKHSGLHRFRFLPGLMLVLATGSVLASDGESHGSVTTCVKANEALPRIVDVQYANPVSAIPCEVLYTKNGQQTSQGNAKNSTGFCEKLERKIVRNLIKGGYDCEHTFTGALAPSIDSSLELDMFQAASQPAAQTSVPLQSRSTDSVADLDEIAANFSRTLTAAFDDQLREKFTAAIRDALDSAPGDYSATEVNIGFAVNVTLAEKDPSTQLEARSTPTSEVTSLSKSGDGESGLGNSRFVVWTDPLTSEAQAQRFAADMHGLYPQVKVKIAAGGATDSDRHWRVILGAGDDYQQFEEALSSLDGSVGDQFEVVDVATAVTDPQQYRYLRDDWARYAIAACYAKGNTTTHQLSECSGHFVDVDNFISCVGGGVCSLDRLQGVIEQENIDLLAAIAADDPIAEARKIVLQRTTQCEQSGSGSEAEFKACIARSLLDEKQLEIVECYSSGNTDKERLLCAAGDEVSSVVEQYEQCSQNQAQLQACVVEKIDSPRLSAAAGCLVDDDPQASLNCIRRSELGVEENRVLDCLQGGGSKADTAQCIADEKLSDRDRQLLNCSSQSSDSVALALCTAEASGQLSGADVQTLQCAVDGQSLDGSNRTEKLLSCAGADYAVTELSSCLGGGGDISACVESNSELSAIANNKIDSVFEDVGLENEIALFRQELYAAEGGDLPTVLSSVVNRKAFSSIEKAGQEVKKKTKGLFDRLLKQ